MGSGATYACRVPDTIDGPIVIADISGYTAFIADTELEHSREILSELLEQIVASLETHLTLAQLEGDAVCFAGTETSPELLDWIEAAVVSFHKRLRDITVGNTCPCRACSTVHTLTLKVIAHHGVYSWHRVGRAQQLVGTPVNVAHRLLKNRVPSSEYLLATEPVLERWPARRSEFTPHTETYDHVGAVAGGYRDLAPLREAARRPERGPVSDAEAKIATDVVLEGNVADAWWLLADARPRQIWMDASSVEYRDGARGTLLGAEFHCHHGGGTTVMRIIDALAPQEMTQATIVGGLEIFITQRVRDAGPRRVHLETLMTWVEPPDPAAGSSDAVSTFMQGWIAQAQERMGELVTARREAARVESP